MSGPGIRIGISSKAFMGYTQSKQWIADIVRTAEEFPAVRGGQIGLFVAPPYPVIESAVAIIAGTGIRIAAQDVSRFPAGAYTGEVPASLLRDLGVEIVELGHTERRELCGETDETVRQKANLVAAHGLTALLCVGEAQQTDPESAATECQRQARAVSGPTILAYEPVWAIGAAAPAPVEWTLAVIARLRALIDPQEPIEIIYGGSAGPGLLARLYPHIDGLFLGRFAHDITNVRAVLREATELLDLGLAN